MTAALLFAATFAAVLTLGIQQINVEQRHMLAAAATSPLIGIAHLVLFKVLPGPTGALEIAAYLAGGSAGIVAGIWAHPGSCGCWPDAGGMRCRRRSSPTIRGRTPSACARRCAWPRASPTTARAPTSSADAAASSSVAIPGTTRVACTTPTSSSSSSLRCATCACAVPSSSIRRRRIW